MCLDLSIVEDCSLFLRTHSSQLTWHCWEWGLFSLSPDPQFSADIALLRVRTVLTFSGPTVLSWHGTVESEDCSQFLRSNSSQLTWHCWEWGLFSIFPDPHFSADMALLRVRTVLYISGPTLLNSHCTVKREDCSLFLRTHGLFSTDTELLRVK